MKYSEIENKETQELRETLKEKRAVLSKLLFDRSQQALKDTSQIGKTKHDIAQILTAISKNQYNIKA